MGQKSLRPALLILAALAGVLLVDGPAAARQRMSFMPGHSHGYAAAHRRSSHPTWRKRYRVLPSRGARRRAPAAEMPAGTVPPGFKMEDGVLTYPAPARFQPKNLKHP